MNSFLMPFCANGNLGSDPIATQEFLVTNREEVTLAISPQILCATEFLSLSLSSLRGFAAAAGSEDNDVVVIRGGPG